MDLINIASGIELWDDVLVAIKTQFNQDKALYVNHVKFLEYLQEKLETTPAKEVADLVLSLDPTIQKNIMQFSPNMKDQELNNWKNDLICALKSENKVHKVEYLSEKDDDFIRRVDITAYMGCGLTNY